MIASDAAHNLRDLIVSTLGMTCSNEDMPHVGRLCFVAHWAVVVLSDGRAGRAFTFNGQHAVYGDLDFEWMRGMRVLVGQPVDAALEQLLDNDSSSDAAQVSLKCSVALALANALSCNLNAPKTLRACGFGITEPTDRSFLRSEDSVVFIGAGMLLQDALSTCAQVDVVDMRPRSALQSLLLDTSGERTGPGRVRFHGVEDTEFLVARADVVGITGCALENDSLFDIVRLSRSAREFVVFGPSAQAPMELFAKLGITRVMTSRIVDAVGLVESMLVGFDAPGLKSATEDYLVTMPDVGIEHKGKGLHYEQ